MELAGTVVTHPYLNRDGLSYSYTGAGLKNGHCFLTSE